MNSIESVGWNAPGTKRTAHISANAPGANRSRFPFWLVVVGSLVVLLTAPRIWTPSPSWAWAQPSAAALPHDTFDGTTLDTCRWFDWGKQATATQDNELAITTSDSAEVSLGEVYSQYMLTGDFDVQVNLRLGERWKKPISPNSPNAHFNAGFGVYQDESNWLFLGINKHQAETEDVVVFSRLHDQFQVVSRVPRKVNQGGKLRIRREEALFRFFVDLGNGWEELSPTSAFSSPGYLTFQATSIGTPHAFTAYFDNFVVNSGETTFRPYLEPVAFLQPPNFRLGGVPNDYLAVRDWGGFWHQLNPLEVLSDNGFEWMRVGVTTHSVPALRDTPPAQWSSLPWRDEYWSSREYAEQIMREAAAEGLRLNVFFFLSDDAAHGGQQNAPPEWAGLSVEETARRVKDYTFETTAYFLEKGLDIELYDIGNEIDTGILNFRPGERIALPPGVDLLRNMDYMRRHVWNIEATLLKSAIAGVKQADPDAQIVLHIAGLMLGPGDLFAKTFFQTMVEFGVAFDFAGLSLPYINFADSRLSEYSTTCWFQRLQETSDFLASLGKPVIFSEAGYAHATPGVFGTPMEDFPYTPAGQAAWARRQLRFLTSNENVAGFFYFYPDWFPGMGNDPSVLNLESMGLFASDTEPLPALKVFQEAKDGEIRDLERLADD